MVKNRSIAELPFPLRVGFFLLILAVLWLPFVGLAYGLLQDANTISIVTMSLLFVEFFGMLRWWGKRVHQYDRPFQQYGLRFSRQNGRELLVGLAIAFLSLFALFIVQSFLGWASWQSPSLPLPRLVVEGLAIALGVGLGEELIFRGWLLNEMQQDYSPSIALWANAIAFAVLHFLRPLEVILKTFPQFLGLVILGVMLVWAKWGRGDRLGLPIGLHAGLVWGFYIVNVGNLITYTGAVPEWVTGIDRNPLAGVMGLLFLSGLAMVVKLLKSEAAPK